MLVVGDVDRTQALLNVAVLWTLVLAIDFLVSISYTVWPRQRRSPELGPRTTDPAAPPATRVSSSLRQRVGSAGPEPGWARPLS